MRSNQGRLSAPRFWVAIHTFWLWAALRPMQVGARRGPTGNCQPPGQSEESAESEEPLPQSAAEPYKPDRLPECAAAATPSQAGGGAGGGAAAAARAGVPLPRCAGPVNRLRRVCVWECWLACGVVSWHDFNWCGGGVWQEAAELWTTCTEPLTEALSKTDALNESVRRARTYVATLRRRLRERDRLTRRSMKLVSNAGPAQGEYSAHDPPVTF